MAKHQAGTNEYRRAQVLQAEADAIHRVLHPDPCPGCLTSPPAPPVALTPCLRCRGWRP